MEWNGISFWIAIIRKLYVATRTKLFIHWECLSQLTEVFTQLNSPINLIILTSPGICATLQHIQACIAHRKKRFAKSAFKRIILRFADRMEMLGFHPSVDLMNTELLKKDCLRIHGKHLEHMCSQLPQPSVRKLSCASVSTLRGPGTARDRRVIKEEPQPLQRSCWAFMKLYWFQKSCMKRHEVARTKSTIGTGPWATKWGLLTHLNKWMGHFMVWHSL